MLRNMIMCALFGTFSLSLTAGTEEAQKLADVYNKEFPHFKKQFGPLDVVYLPSEKNYAVLFDSKEQAQRYSEYLGEGHPNIRGSGGGLKYVMQHLHGNPKFGVILTESDLKKLNNLISFYRRMADPGLR